MRENPTSEGLRVVGAGVDSLYLAYAFEPSPRVVRALEVAKAAQNKARRSGFHPTTGEPLASAPEPVEAGGVMWTVRPYGASCAPLLAVNDRYAQWALNPGDAGSAPTLQAKVFSSALWRTGEGASVMLERMDELARSLSRDGSLERRYVQRLDVCADFQGWTPQLSDQELFSARGGPTINRFRADDLAEDLIATLDPKHLRMALLEAVMDDINAWFRWRFTGLRIGQTGVVVRLYCKTAEIKVSGKKWFLYVWENAGDAFDPTADVWRLEVQLPHEYLKTLRDDGSVKLDTCEDVLANAGAVWRTVLTEKVRLTIGDTTRLSNATTHPAWAALTNTAEIDGVAEGGGVTSLQQDKITTRELIPKLAGYVTKYGALEGIENLDDALLAAHGALKDHFEERGETFQQAAKKKADARREAQRRENDADIRAAATIRARTREARKVCERRVPARWSRRPQQLAFQWRAPLAQLAFRWSA